MLLAQVLSQTFGALGSDVDAALGHDPDCQRVDLARFQAGAEGLVAIVAAGAQKGLGNTSVRTHRSQSQHPPR